MEKKGFTLIELILAIALMGIIATGFISYFGNYYSWMMFTKNEITLDVFDAQESMEQRISNIRSMLAQGNNPDSDDFDSTKEDIFLFSSDFPKSSFSNRENVKAYIIEEEVSDSDKLITWVGETRMVPLPVPTLDRPAQVFVRNGSNPTDSYEDLLQEHDKLEYYNYSNLRMYSLSRLAENPQNSFYKNKHDWYVSEPGFLIPTPPSDEIDEDNDLGRLYPSYPNNYNPIPIYSPELNSVFHNSLSNGIVNQYKGRHIVYTVTPYSKDLKRGILEASFPLYVMGPENTTNLVVHLNASTLRVADTDSIEEDTSMGYTVKFLKNLRPTPTTVNNYNAVQSVLDKRPVLVSDIPYGDPSYISPALPFQGEGTDKARIWGRALGNKPTTVSDNISSMTIENIGMSNGNYNIFMIIRKVESPFGPLLGGIPIIRGISNVSPWSLNWKTNSTLELSALYNSDPVDYPGVFTSDYSFNTGEWNLLHIQFDPSTLSYSTYNLTKNKEDIRKIASDTDKIPYAEISTNGIEINFNGVQLAELLLYTSMDTYETGNTIKFLRDKYNN